MSGLEVILPMAMAAASGVIGAGSAYAEGKSQEVALKQQAADAEQARRDRAAVSSRNAERIDKDISFLERDATTPASVLGELIASKKQSQADADYMYRADKSRTAAANKSLKSQAKVAGNTTASQLSALLGGASKAYSAGSQANLFASQPLPSTDPNSWKTTVKFG